MSAFPKPWIAPDTSDTIPFNRPYLVGTELDHVREAHTALHLSGDGGYTALCRLWLERQVGCAQALLTHSCTAALEMSALLLDIAAGDEIVMPSYTFVSTANAFVLRGGVPVFVDIRPDTLNMDESLIEDAITERTVAIVVVHYAGIACAMDPIRAIAERHGIVVVEDAAQGVMSTYRGRPLGSFGELGAMSFHETKNLTAGEAGALLVNATHFVDRSQVIREKGTNRTRFLEGRIEKYTWIDVGSSYLPSELIAAFLWGQMGAAEEITRERLRIWARYHAAFADLEADGRITRPFIPDDCTGNGHMYWVLLPDDVPRATFLARMKACGIEAVSHYVPLHDSPAGLRFARTSGPMTWTVRQAARLVRLPIWIGLGDEQERVIDAVRALLGNPAAR